MTNAGTVGRHDLTVPDAMAIRDVHGSVIGWTSTLVGVDRYGAIPDPAGAVCALYEP